MSVIGWACSRKIVESMDRRAVSRGVVVGRCKWHLSVFENVAADSKGRGRGDIADYLKGMDVARNRFSRPNNSKMPGCTTMSKTLKIHSSAAKSCGNGEIAELIEAYRGRRLATQCNRLCWQDEVRLPVRIWSGQIDDDR